MDINQIVEWVVAILPSVIAVLTTVGLVVKTLKEFTALHNQVTDMKAMEDVKTQLKLLLQQNYELKSKLDKTISKMNHVQKE